MNLPYNNRHSIIIMFPIEQVIGYRTLDAIFERQAKLVAIFSQLDSIAIIE